ncbi:DUF1189 family protein [candidate division WWE3 bacterium]|nr:DUF1189 family protein [candidate division WWE3 bacterium]
MKILQNTVEHRVNKLKTFFHVFGKSSSSFDYYKDIERAPFRLSVKYLLALLFIATTVTTIKSAIPIFKNTEPDVRNALENMEKLYPQDLILTIQDGKLTSNKTEAVIIKNPSYGGKSEIGKTENLIVIDENGVIEDLKSKNTLMVLNSKNLLVQDPKQVIVYPLSKFPDVQIDKTFVQKTAQDALPMIKILPYIIVTLLFGITYAFYVVSRFIYLLAVACVLWGFTLLLGETFSFGKLYQFGIHAMTLPLVLEVILDIVAPSIDISFAFPILNIIIAIGGMLYATRKDSTA